MTSTPLPKEPPTTGTGVTRYVVAAMVVSVLAIVLAVRNSDRVDVDLLVWSGEAPVYALAFVAALVGGALTALLSAVWRHRRMAVNRERREAVDLRERVAGIDAHGDPVPAPVPTPDNHEETVPSWPSSPPSA